MKLGYLGAALHNSLGTECGTGNINSGQGESFFKGECIILVDWTTVLDWTSSQTELVDWTSVQAFYLNSSQGDVCDDEKHHSDNHISGTWSVTIQ